MNHYIFLVSCAILFLIPVLFVMNDVYDDGLIGRVFLLGISFASATFLMEFAAGDSEYVILPQTVFLVASFAGFLCWHLFRFHRRVLKHEEGVKSWGTREERRSKWI